MHTFQFNLLTVVTCVIYSVHTAHWSPGSSRHSGPFVDSSETKSLGGKCTCQCEAPKIVRVEVPKIQIKYIPVVVKSTKEEIDTHDVQTVKSTDDSNILRATHSPIEYTSKHLPSKYGEDAHTQGRPSSSSVDDTVGHQTSSHHSSPSSSPSSPHSHESHHHSSQSRVFSSMYPHHHHHHHQQVQHRTRDYKEPNGREISLPPLHSRDHIRSHQQVNDQLHHDSSHFASINAHDIGIEYARR